MYKPLENLRYLSKVLWKFDRRIFPLAVAEALIGALIPYLSVLIPKYAIAGILEGMSSAYWVMFLWLSAWVGYFFMRWMHCFLTT